MKNSRKITSILFGLLVAVGYAGISKNNAWEPLEFGVGLLFGIVASLSLLRKPPVRVSLFIPFGLLLLLLSLPIITVLVEFNSQILYVYSWAILLTSVYGVYIFQSPVSPADSIKEDA